MTLMFDSPLKKLTESETVYGLRQISIQKTQVGNTCR